MSEPLAYLEGLICTAVKHDAEAHSWRFSFGKHAHLNVAAAWRLVTDGGIVLGWQDHGQLFGLKRPVDGQVVFAEAVGPSPIRAARVADQTADLRITFENGAVLEVFNDSSGYEAWQLGGRAGQNVVAQGGGQVAVWEPDV